MSETLHDETSQPTPVDEAAPTTPAEPGAEETLAADAAPATPAAPAADEVPAGTADGYVFNKITEDDLGTLSFDDAVDQTMSPSTRVTS